MAYRFYCVLGPEQSLASGYKEVSSLNNVDIFNQLETWPDVKTEVATTRYDEKCVNPMEAMGQPESRMVTPNKLAGTEFGQLPSLWSGLGRMPWIGFGERDPSEWLQMGVECDILEQNDSDDDLRKIDYDKLL